MNKNPHIRHMSNPYGTLIDKIITKISDVNNSLKKQMIKSEQE
jgi:uncharacterized protein (DUF2461 family)